MSMETPQSVHKPESTPRERHMKAVDDIETGDFVLANGHIDEITSKVTSAAGITLKLRSGGILNVDTGSDEIEVPQ